MTRLVLLALAGAALAFQPQPAMTPLRRTHRPSRLPVSMGKTAKFGIFSPAVYAGRVVLGDKRLEKLRGKGISLHSQAITEFCLFVGATPKTRGLLIKKAKTNGDTLGFLV
ncbi:hypothetical protein CTAYLR_006362 [Chrysophaeum taylorii]|uniref:Uncharacterized protein n=1 Tax=Chrysophaeum taylorii TaxID=2483200 RepID=A0AAD7U6E8_9STRA|nr:hypothetical protein CTAYLR_006362 [Chrysophaeum taylorii]